MIATQLTATIAEFAAGTGWDVKPEGACRGDVCVPLSKTTSINGKLDLVALAEQLAMPIVANDAKTLFAIGPASLSGRALVTAAAPELVLPDLAGKPFALSSLRGRKVALVAWSPY